MATVIFMLSEKKICYLNSSTTGSTGVIVNSLARAAATHGYESMFLSRGTKNPNYLGEYTNILPHRFSYLFSRTPTFLIDGDGFRSKNATKLALGAIDAFKPQIIHIHNPHGSIINIQSIFKYAKSNGIKIIWTLHDAWTVTGRCGYPFFCKGWKTGCKTCPNHAFYPRVFFSQSKKFFRLKHDLIDLLITSQAIFVSPSMWLVNFFRSSYPNADVRLIRNGIDISIFKPDGGQNDQILKFASGRKVIGGTSLSAGKGGFYFEELSKHLDPKKYCIVVVGCPESKIVSTTLMNLKSLSSREEMASFYRTIWVLLSPTQNDNFPTTHLESISCGAPVLTFNVGGASEMIEQGVNGYSVSLNDKEALFKKLSEMLDRDWDRKIVSSSQTLTSNRMSDEYVNTYDQMLNR